MTIALGVANFPYTSPATHSRRRPHSPSSSRRLKSGHRWQENDSRQMLIQSVIGLLHSYSDWVRAANIGRNGKTRATMDDCDGQCRLMGSADTEYCTWQSHNASHNGHIRCLSCWWAVISKKWMLPLDGCRTSPTPLLAYQIIRDYSLEGQRHIYSIIASWPRESWHAHWWALITCWRSS